MNITSSRFVQFLFLAWRVFLSILRFGHFVFQGRLTFSLFQFINALMEYCDKIAGWLCYLKLWISLFLLIDEESKIGFKAVNLLIAGVNIALLFGDGFFHVSAIPKCLHWWSCVAGSWRLFSSIGIHSVLATLLGGGVVVGFDSSWEAHANATCDRACRTIMVVKGGWIGSGTI